MSDHKELLERLRYLEKNDPYVMTMSFGPDITEAADAIEALKAENERLRFRLEDAAASMTCRVGDDSAHYCPNKLLGHFSKDGLTKREYFAAMAMQGFATKGWEQNMAANWAVEYADALLEALERKPE